MNQKETHQLKQELGICCRCYDKIDWFYKGHQFCDAHAPIHPVKKFLGKYVFLIGIYTSNLIVRK